ncbi:hypothetical protein ACFC63_27490 [Streptomyces albidoflavus]
MAQALKAREGELPDGIIWWLTAPVEEFPDDPSVVVALADSVMDQGSTLPGASPCSPVSRPTRTYVRRVGPC